MDVFSSKIAGGTAGLAQAQPEQGQGQTAPGAAGEQDESVPESSQPPRNAAPEPAVSANANANASPVLVSAKDGDGSNSACAPLSDAVDGDTELLSPTHVPDFIRKCYKSAR